MARAVGSASRRHHGTAAASTTPRRKPPLSLNDDAQEKAVRLQSRQALHDMQMNQIKAAVSPMRRLDAYNRAVSSSPRTPSGSIIAPPKQPENDGLQVVDGKVVTPMKRVPILANFEEWMKMATDNKINAANSWNFALIDYFHDMSLLKEGDGVNFQKASCTLDGCVKIYTSRVDSVATETGKLLSGLADSGNKRGRDGDQQREDGEEGDEEDEEGEDGVKKRARRKAQRSEATLAPSFAPLQLKKFELEFSVDPLFKKASADFDEGGAKGLLLNHLAIDSLGRIVFDSSDDALESAGDTISRRKSNLEQDQDQDTETAAETTQQPETTQEIHSSSVPDEPKDIDISGLANRFFPNLDILDEQDICPSLKNFDLGDSSGGLDIPFLKASSEEWKQNNHMDDDCNRSNIDIDEDNAGGFDDDGVLGGFDVPADAEFGDGGEAWARDAALEPQLQPYDNASEDPTAGDDVLDVGGFAADSSQYGISLVPGNQKNGKDHENILNYFDQALHKNWAGPEHWRIRKIKDIAKAASSSPKSKKEKEPFEIDFLAPLSTSAAESLYTQATSNSAISLPKAQWKSKNRNLLPDDKHFNSRDLLRLFLKPRAQLGSRQNRSGRARGFANQSREQEGEIDEAFWARKEDPMALNDDEQGIGGNYDANFFQDDGLAFPGGLPDDDDDEFADAREHFSPGLETDEAGNALPGEAGQDAGANPDGGFGAQLVTQSRRLRPEYVQYARIAKKVDVRRLKEEMWKGMALEKPAEDTSTIASPKPQPRPVSKTDDGSLMFTSVMGNLQDVYPKQAMADISTSYCFICLLHLANEKGLDISSNEGLTELSIKKDESAVIEGEA